MELFTRLYLFDRIVIYGFLGGLSRPDRWPYFVRHGRGTLTAPTITATGWMPTPSITKGPVFQSEYFMFMWDFPAAPTTCPARRHRFGPLSRNQDPRDVDDPTLERFLHGVNAIGRLGLSKQIHGAVASCVHP